MTGPRSASEAASGAGPPDSRGRRAGIRCCPRRRRRGSGGSRQGRCSRFMATMARSTCFSMLTRGVSVAMEARARRTPLACRCMVTRAHIRVRASLAGTFCRSRSARTASPPRCRMNASVRSSRDRIGSRGPTRAGGDEPRRTHGQRRPSCAGGDVGPGLPVEAPRTASPIPLASCGRGDRRPAGASGRRAMSPDSRAVDSVGRHEAELADVAGVESLTGQPAKGRPHLQLCLGDAALVRQALGLQPAQERLAKDRRGEGLEGDAGELAASRDRRRPPRGARG